MIETLILTFCVTMGIFSSFSMERNEKKFNKKNKQTKEG